ncbi:hypothetical protein L9F63_010338 [Diploptera punctata]|uniref:Proline-rich transmembrane protein 3/4 domain-containing protein n=1 Tax=Diploptera punctata TaxID=6984 RepID=A0AAD8AIA3_DIPPU|nr:hypothetical protein L9F63_010338 [Diploptera punctata]
MMDETQYVIMLEGALKRHTIKQVCQWIKKSWSRVREDIIVKSFKRSSRQTTWRLATCLHCCRRVSQPQQCCHIAHDLLAPSFETLKSQLRWGLLLHTYGFACLFFMLAFYAFFSILNLRSLISSRPFMSTINGFLCLLGVSRAGCLFIDPYNLREAMPKVMGSVLWDVGFPCITSAFCLIQLAFLQLTQLNLGPEKLRRKSCLSLIITAHFSFIIGADIAVGFQEQLMIVKFVVQLVFILWGVFLCCTFLYGGYRVMGLLRNMPGGLLQREPPDHNRKGIMQLALLAPYNNLASSVAAALVPTLLTPKIRITDENDRTFSYGSDSNSQPTDPNQPAALEQEVEIPTRAAVRPGSPDPRRKVVPGIQVRPPTPVPTIVVSPGSRRSSLASRRGSDIASICGSRRGSEVSRRGSEADGMSKEPPSSPVSPNRKKSLSWQRSNPLDSQRRVEQAEDEVTAETSLLPQQESEDKGSGDLTLHSILNHIAYVNRAALPTQPVSSGSAHTSRKSQVQRVLNATYITALLGLILCLADLGRLCGPYGLLMTSNLVKLQRIEMRPWPWFCFQTMCRLLEFAMGCAMANITKQPVNSRHQYLQQQYAYSLRLKQHRESLYI